MSNQPESKYSRRGFLKILGGTAAGLYVAAVVPRKFLRSEDGTATASSEAYLLVDMKKCQGCTTCMLACSLAHEGVASLSLSRIQIIQNSFEKWPDDILIAQCRQCTEPLCMKACPTGALCVESAKGNVRIIDERKCIGCMQCIEACPFTPSRMQWNFEAKQSQKCDLCTEVPFWNKSRNDGQPVCVTLCPIGAITVVSEIPKQTGEEGYNVNLRDQGWNNLSMSDEPEKLRSDRTGEDSWDLVVKPYSGRWEARTDLISSQQKMKGEDV